MTTETTTATRSPVEAAARARYEATRAWDAESPMWDRLTDSERASHLRLMRVAIAAAAPESGRSGERAKFGELPEFWQGYIEGMSEDHAAAVILLREQVEKLTRERDFEQSSRLTADAHLGAIISNLHAELAKLREGAEPVACEHDWEKTREDLCMFVCSKCRQAYSGNVLTDKPSGWTGKYQGHPTEQTDARSGVEYAERIARALHERHYSDVQEWRPLSGDLIGLLTQIDNMTSGMSRTEGGE